MVEITHGGTWFKWSSLDRRDKWLAGLSIAASLPSGVVAGIMLGGAAHRIGHLLGGDGFQAPADTVQRMVDSAAYRSAAMAALALAIVSALAWWRFSLRQDELFNRIQNYSMGRAGGWSMGIATGWWFLQLAGLAGAFPLGAFLLAMMLLLLGFWFHGVRRWA